MAGKGLTIDIRGDARHFERAMSRVGKSIGYLPGALAKVAKATVQVGVAAAATAAAFSAWQMKKVIDLGGEMSDLSARTGIAAGEIKVLQEAMRIAGVQGGDVAKVMQTLGKNISYAFTEGTSEAGRAIGMLGLNVADLRNYSLDTSFDTIGRAIAAMKNEVDRARVVMALFGKQGQPLVTLFKDFDEQMGRARNNVGGLAGVLNRMSGTFDRISDQLGSVGLKVQQFYAGLTEQLAPGIAKGLSAFEEFDFTDLGRKIGIAIRDAVTGNSEALEAIGRLIGAYIKAGMEATTGIGVSAVGNNVAALVANAFDPPANYSEELRNARNSRTLFPDARDIASGSLSSQNPDIRIAIEETNRLLGEIKVKVGSNLEFKTQ